MSEKLSEFLTKEKCDFPKPIIHSLCSCIVCFKNKYAFKNFLTLKSNAVYQKVQEKECKRIEILVSQDQCSGSQNFSTFNFPLAN